MPPLNRFQFEPVQNRQDPTETLEFPETDPRNDPLYAHPGYNKVFPGQGDVHYEHASTGRRLSRDQYHSATRMLDRAMDVHYGDE
jgi:hypothetical protein